jgi:hypothetical protein
MRPSPLLLPVLTALLLGACQSTSGGPPPAPPPEQAAPGVTPSTFRMPGGAGCSGEVERFQAVIDNDVATGHTTKSVHERMSGEIAQARTLCSSGNEAGAIGRIRTTKAKFGYPN